MTLILNQYACIHFSSTLFIKMTVTHLMIQPDAVNDLGLLILRSSTSLEHVGAKTLGVMKFLLYDVTLSLNKLPFGNWISLVYFLLMTFSIKNVVEGGELNRVLGRMFELYFIQQNHLANVSTAGNTISGESPWDKWQKSNLGHTGS